MEVIFVPGTTLVGILGTIMGGVGVYLAYVNFGVKIGTVVLVSASFLAILSLVISFKSGVWKKFALKDQILSKVNEHIPIELKEGDLGIAISSLKPVGKAEFNDRVFEVKTNGNYVDAGNQVKVIKVNQQKIIVEPFKSES